MYLLQKATQLTVDRDTLTDLYAYPATDAGTCHVRANMVTSLDGAAAADGLSAGLGGDGDKQVFGLLRDLADVVLVGSATVTQEGYGPIDPGGDDPSITTLAIVSGSLHLDADQDAVTAASTVVLTHEGAPADRRARLVEAGATLLDCGTDDVDLHRALAHLADRGRTRVLCEGGPGLLAALFADDLVDELCLTTGPTLIGGDAGRITHGDTGGTRRLRRAHVLADDEGFLFTRWVRGERGESTAASDDN
ncbi:MAG: pyrimidine reductase family protein [Corynebacteriales bacterium]|nr:pyrimidine reductase family protein [Mycobacteriales bacterium]